MSIFKCKMCGGTLEFAENEKVGVCDSCGTKQTLPSFSDDAILNLFNRANTLRLKAEFDKAEEIYGKIIEKEPDNAEARWGIILCKYGIEYVEDPKTYRRVPTCHRASFDAVTADSDYKAAIANADISSKALYEAEAAEIDRLQKDILAVAENEKPFDVFICYKETDANGSRTNDSVIANDIYHELTEEGYKVFYSAITLEDKLGVEYEPYIFAALNSAKVMLVIGTKPEYFTAVWVKNEWSRFLKIIKADRKKLLIPCYKDMDAYELPEEFAHFQAQDMSKIGFINDVGRGIKKVISKDEAEVKTVVETVSVNNVGSNVSALLKRGYMALEDEEWGKADGFFEDALNQDAENADAYFGKLMAELHVKKQEELKNLEHPFDNSKSYQKALRFADPATAEKLKGYITYINDRNENTRLTGIYNSAKNAMSAANTESAFKAAADTFSTISGFKDADALAEQCLDKAEVCRKDAIYASAKSSMTGVKMAAYETAIKTFQTISGWKDADEQIYACQKKIEEIKAKEEADRLEAARKAEERRVAAKKRKKAFAIGTPIVAACIAFVIVLTTVIIPNSKYNDAVSLMNDSKYKEAISAFEAMDGYKDSKEKISACQTALKDIDYNAAVSLMNSGKYEEAISALEAMDGYKDSKEKISACQTALKDIDYNAAVALMNEKKYYDAFSAFEALNGYKDSTDKASDCLFLEQKSNFAVIKKGDIIKFGAYEQDNDIFNGKEEIEWIVLDVEGGKALVISKYALICKKYNTSSAHVTWEKCTLRKWLNDVFMYAAFSTKHMELIASVSVSADKNPKYSTKPGNATTDKAFLLSITEAEKYFTTDKSRKCAPTAFAAQGAFTIIDDNEAACLWWLRSPGIDQNYAIYVLWDGSVRYNGYYVNYDYACVRPALWINLDS